MEKYLNRFYDVIDKIGKHNFILVVFIFVALLSTGLYQTFSLYTESEGLNIIDNIKTYSFILKNNGEENSIVVAANSSKNIDITVTNESETNLKYGLYYSSSLSEDDINIGYLTSTVYQPSGVVPKSTSYVVTIKVDNLTEENVTINFGLKYGFENGGELGLEEGDYWFNTYEEITYPLLSEMPVGSYVAYTGNNGCDTTKVNGWSSCDGKNANYISDENMGSCNPMGYNFNVNGWRIGYIENNNAYLVSAGSTDCMNSCFNNTSLEDPGVDGGYCSALSINTIDSFYSMMNDISLNYCNIDYVKGGVCDNTTTWAINASDFGKIAGSPLNANSCYSSSNDASCGYNNDLIDNGGNYWFATRYSSSSNETLFWYPFYRKVSSVTSDDKNGVRPVLIIDSSVIVTGGKGTYDNPFTISKRSVSETITYLNTADVGSYVKYEGDNGCDNTNTINGWTSCGGKNANYVSDIDMGYCYSSKDKFKANGWRIAYIKNESVHLISAGSIDCIDITSSNYLENALKYCNPIYANGGLCNNSTTWGIAEEDFKIMTGSNSFAECENISSEVCGKNNDLIDIGGHYWFYDPEGWASDMSALWSPADSFIYNSQITFDVDPLGLRPVISLSSSVRITGGTGTYVDPYIISNN